ncbi:DUF6634 family protein [Yoonia sp. 2307UL14-13]|uniref:DUF6634 family protein n=1 Tax=Yoonia sp. 2307UL14-13 TaxID=3126506 RepID=UPI0030A4F4AA
MDLNDADHALLDKLKSVKPVWVGGFDDGTLVRWDDIDPDLIALIRDVAPNLEPILIDGARYVLPLEWVLAAEDIWRLLTTRMRLRSLELAVIGPSKRDIVQAPVLTGWVSIRSEYGIWAHLVGEVDGHPASIGPMIRTSPLCGLDRDFSWARTVSRCYRLEDRSTPEDFHRKWGSKADGISAMAIEVWEAEAICAAVQISEGVREE